MLKLKARCHFESIVEPLEGRVLLSSGTEAADKAQLAKDKSQLSRDSQAASALLSADRTKLADDRTELISPVQTQLKEDVAKGKQALLDHRAAAAASVTDDHNAIAADQKLLAADANDPTAHTADQAKLTADKQLLATDTADLQTTLANDRANTLTAVQADNSALASARHFASSTITADLGKITSDTKSIAKTLFNDNAAIVVDRAKVAADEVGSFLGGLL